MNTFFLTPLSSLFASLFRILYTLTGNHGIALILLSVLVSGVLIPLQILAERMRQKDHQEKEKFAADQKVFKTHYAGSERFYYLQTLHKIHAYHPIKSLRGLVGLLIQVPFFIGAYQFLSHFTGYKGIGFLFISDLSQPDGLLGGLNLLPFLMTGINLLTVFLFFPSQEKSEKYPLYGLSALFLILLYNAPAGLVFYWTMNMVFSLGKSGILYHHAKHRIQGNQTAGPQILIGQSSKNSMFFLLIALCCYLALIYIPRPNHGNKGSELTSLILATLFFVIFAYFSIRFFLSLKSLNKKPIAVLILVIILWLLLLLFGYAYASQSKILTPRRRFKELSIFFMFLGIFILLFRERKKYLRHLGHLFYLPRKQRTRKFFVPTILMASFALSFLLFIIPSVHIMASSPGEFPEKSGIFLLLTFLFIILYALSVALLYFLGKRHYFLALFSSLFILLFILVNYFFLPGNYGIMDFFIFHIPQNLTMDASMLLEGIALFLFLLISSYLIIKKIQPKFILVGLRIVGITLALSLIPSLYSIITTKEPLLAPSPPAQASSEKITPEGGKQEFPYSFSTTGKNVLVIFYDRFVGGFVPDILSDKPELKHALSGFTWYPNTLSFDVFTARGLPPIYGGYAFTDVNKLKEKVIHHNKKNHLDMLQHFKESSSYTIQKFLDAGFQTFINDPSFLGGEWYGDIDIARSWGSQSRAENLIGKYSKDFLSALEEKGFLGVKEYNSSEEIHAPFNLVFRYLLPYSLFKITAAPFRHPLYNRGAWWNKVLQNSHLVKSYVDHLSLAQAWPQISQVDEATPGHYIFATNKMTHEAYGVALDEGKILIKTEQEGLSENNNSLPKEAIERFGNESSAFHYFASKEALIRAASWFTWMKENNVYDNTLIIIVSDHGNHGIYNPMFEQTISPEGYYYSAYHPIFMVKDFKATGDMQINHRFMTNADVPALTLSAIDPQASEKYGQDKSQGFRLYTEKGNLTVYDNIFDPKNWIYTKD